jgi:hypothetical protein
MVGMVADAASIKNNDTGIGDGISFIKTVL